MTVTDPYLEVIAHRHDYARSWKERTGGKVVGYFCTYVPEELIYATGALPVRILGSHEPQDLTDRHISATGWCAYCRDCLAQGLQGRYDYLDGVVNAYSCFHIRQTYFSWTKHVPTGFTYQLYVPNSIHLASARACFESEVRDFAGSLEAWLGRKISSAALERAVDIYNADRRLLRQIYELRRGERQAMTGAQAMAMVLSSQLMDKEEHVRLVGDTLQAATTGGDTLPGDHPRILLMGSENDDLELVRLIESLGCAVVVDEHCTGSRYFWQEVPRYIGADLPAAIAHRYLERPPCPHKDVSTPQRRRLSHLLELARDYRVQGVIIIRQLFCDTYAYEVPVVQSAFRDLGIPSLVLEVEFTLPAGQFRTRIEAFLETLRQGLD